MFHSSLKQQKTKLHCCHTQGIKPEKQIEAITNMSLLKGDKFFVSKIFSDVWFILFLFFFFLLAHTLLAILFESQSNPSYSPSPEVAHVL